MPWNLEEILAATGGRILQKGKRRSFGEVVTDSAKVRRGSIFIALKGERHDGHQFVGDAVKRGASCVLVHRRPDISGYRKVTFIRVRDTLRALGDVARYRREKFAPAILAITGSNGKTTTREMVAAILENASVAGIPLRGKVLKTDGNYNNLVGLPLTLLRLRGHERAAVVELGTSRPGEIERLCQIALPDIGLITSVAPAHLTGLSTVAGVAREKGAMYQGIRPGGKAIVNLDDPWVRRLGRKFKGEKVTYGKGGEVRIESSKSLGARGLEFMLRAGKKRCVVRMRLCGKHSLANALGAAAMARAFGATLTAIRKGLKAVKPFPMRMQIEQWRGIGIINDAYNANPASMAAALETLAEIGRHGKKIAILGDMLELGSASSRLHMQLGRKAARLRVDRLYLLGEQAERIKKGALGGGMDPERVIIGKDHGELARMLRRCARKGDWVLFKGSRGMRMERVLEELRRIRG